jgi:hypothetical protein
VRPLVCVEGTRFAAVACTVNYARSQQQAMCCTVNHVGHPHNTNDGGGTFAQASGLGRVHLFTKKGST